MKNKIALQIAFWIILLGINLALGFRPDSDQEVWLLQLVNVLSYGLVFYINILFLFPDYYETKRGLYILYSFLMIVLVSIGVTLFDHLFIHKHFGSNRKFDFPDTADLFSQSFWYILTFLLGSVYSMQNKINQQITSNKLITEEKLQTKLQLLKNQINPHFLFNALNNVYTLSYTNSKKAPESILKLSEMLRYVIEECNQEYVTLGSEVAYIQNYLEFYKLKSPGKRKISFSINIENQNLHIAPMLFIPFVENGFKYSRIEEDKDGFIDITLNEKDGIILFSCKNSVFSQRTILKGSGQGISNVQQRLEIIYPEKHSFVFKEDEKTYYIELKLQL